MIFLWEIFWNHRIYLFKLIIYVYIIVKYVYLCSWIKSLCAGRRSSLNSLSIFGFFWCWIFFFWNFILRVDLNIIHNTYRSVQEVRSVLKTGSHPCVVRYTKYTKSLLRIDFYFVRQVTLLYSLNETGRSEKSKEKSW